MINKFDTEEILSEVLAVFEKHAIPVQTVAINLSLRSDDFEATFPHLKTYKAGRFSRALVIHDIPVAVQIQRRIRFDEFVHGLERHILHSVTQIAEDVRRISPAVDVKLQVGRIGKNLQWPEQVSYHMTVRCHIGDKKVIVGNVVQLSIYLTQLTLTSYPMISADVAWLVDEESGGDFGLEMVSELFHGQKEATEGTLELLQRGLPHLHQKLRSAIQERLSW